MAQTIRIPVNHELTQEERIELIDTFSKLNHLSIVKHSYQAGYMELVLSDKGRIITLDFDWAEFNGWKCSFCGGEIDHLCQEDYEDEGYAEDSYTCQNKGGSLCEYAYFMVRWSLTKRGDNGDALTLKHFVDLEISDVYLND